MTTSERLELAARRYFSVCGAGRYDYGRPIPLDEGDNHGENASIHHSLGKALTLARAPDEFSSSSDHLAATGTRPQVPRRGTCKGLSGGWAGRSASSAGARRGPRDGVEVEDLRRGCHAELGR